MIARLTVAAAVLAISLVIAETLRAMPSGLAAVGLVLFGAVVAPAIVVAPSPLAVGLGAVAALAYTALRPAAPIPAIAIFVTMLFAARALRARTAAAVVLQLAVAALGAITAGRVLLQFHDASSAVRLVAIGVAALLVSVPLLLAVEESRVGALLAAARRTRGTARMQLLRAAALRRRLASAELAMGKQDALRIDRAFDTVLRLGEARAGSRAIDLVAVDRALAAHVTALARLMRALRARWASGEAIAAHGAHDLAAAGERVLAEAAALDELG
jgi:hypothetical protein